MEKPVALFMNCDEKSNTKSHLNKTFSEQLVKSSFISSNFGYEINPDEGNFIDKIKAKKTLSVKIFLYWIWMKLINLLVILTI